MGFTFAYSHPLQYAIWVNLPAILVVGIVPYLLEEVQTMVFEFVIFVT